MEISEIIYRLLGEIEPYGDTNIDTERYENLENYEIVLGFIIDKLKNSAILRDRPEYSIQRIAKECDMILDKYQIMHH